jgi:phenylpyruvate tautomerase PptA (4-oxalocrotonate tautomerase family)
MPFIRVELLVGKTPAFKQAVLDQVHEALVEAFRIPDHDRTQRLIELPPEHFEFPIGRRPDPILIEITCFTGRSIEAKHLLYRRLTERLKDRPGVDVANVCIVLKEVPRENWGLGGLGADQIDLGFKVDV